MAFQSTALKRSEAGTRRGFLVKSRSYDALKAPRPSPWRVGLLRVPMQGFSLAPRYLKDSHPRSRRKAADSGEAISEVLRISRVLRNPKDPTRARDRVASRSFGRT